MNLISNSRHTLRAMACGQSIDLNVKHKFYFDLASRGYSDFNYLGIYKEKSVQYIAKVEVMVLADLDEENGLIIHHPEKGITEDQKRRLIEAMKDAIDHGWDVNENHRFFLLKDFYKTDFRKTTPGGIFRVRYFNLEDYFDKVPESLEEIARKLEGKTWEKN